MKNRVLKIIFILVMSFSLVLSQAGSLFASDDSRESLEEYLEELKVQIETNNQNLDDIYNSIYEVNDKIADNNVYLEELMVSLDNQKADMTKRIQYMYEAGASMDILLALLTAESIADSLNKAQYISQIVSYDRDMLDNYVKTIHAVNDTQIELENMRSELIELKNSFEDAKYEAALALEEATVRLEEYDIEPEQVQQVIEDYMEIEEVIVIPEIDIPIEDIIEAEEDTKSDEAAAAPEASEEIAESQSEPVTETVKESEATSETETEPETTTAEETTETTTEETTTEETTTEETTTEAEEETEPEVEEEEEEEDSSYYVPISTYSYSEQEIYDLARVTYLEDGCVYPEGSYRSIYLCACVIINRANNWYGGSISSAIYAGGQYATAYKYTSWGGGPLVINDITWEAVNDALANCDPNPYYQCNGDHLASMGLTEYYRDPGTNEVFYYDY